MTKMFINGQSVNALSGKVLDVLSPVDGQKFEEIPRGEKADVDLAVNAANKALDSAWGKMTALERGRLLMKLGEKVLEHHAELAALEARDTGKPMTTAKTDITVLARYFEFYGSGADKIHGLVLPFLDGYTVNVLREPLGVTAHIIPWNYPAQMLGRSIAPALAMGNAVVVKPAEDACLTPIRVAELARDVGFPDGAINIVTGLGEEAGAALSEHPGINFISFTGSNEVGVLIQKAAAKNVIKCVLELGGKSPHVVFGDADLDRAVPIITRGIIANTGQTCTAGSRLIVQKSIYPEIMERLAKQFAQIKVGTPDMDLDCGPVVNIAQRDRVAYFLKEAEKSGIEMVAQGVLSPGLPKEGYYVTPTLLGNVPANHRCAQEEIFGPVLAAMSFDTEAEGIALANGTDFGLMAAVWTENGGRQQRVSKAIKAGQVYINAFGAGGGVELPFGGVKRSGHGREKGFLALEEVSTTKTVINYHG
ncbi:aldehyde dehydrogenase [Limnohabitans sp. Rim8]|jgi:aldehyde dehydrogenase (NAD+)|uniref:4-(hydroxymethyl)benzenesulfonate dehydrogenase n=1 Tax=Limnohabitans curvus TaxID=323423 RepID=A0A315EW20_9BURK|nr:MULTISPECIES: aldehyde dehydrogenase family protein [Limnohabitans]PUE57593.1 aldehyde dehydrogenase [Limnohabitans sp. Rim8]PUE60144.1 aldehyde dehydrogenase [Limnohabitans curvus]